MYYYAWSLEVHKQITLEYLVILRFAVSNVLPLVNINESLYHRTLCTSEEK